ncbi:carbohydrate kinase family protein [Fusibacter ferrireducens]|uniref:Carbohydrate kinase n=1 Tax=Fusibacter ferrireducens TaxID=2785058 RepID=A0ABR9ZZQ0_9FIRM|nr:carbohydrate kinase [Fusibacter ferrireducens]MBF4695461.1 carbohydrate kinase [Fusibacter ferrireducens]
MYDIIAVGELLIDFTPAPDAHFKANPGGAPCNFLTMAQNLGSKTAFIGKVGADAFGNSLKLVLSNQGIDVNGLIQDNRFGTTLAFVHLTPEGDRSFSFYRKGCADVMLYREDVDFDQIDQTKALHFGSLSFTDEPSRSTVLAMLEYAKSKNKIITYDPNYRPALWDDSASAIDYMKKGMAYADIVKVSDEELELISGNKDLSLGCKILHDIGVKMIFVTLGGKGSFYSYAKGSGIVPGIEVNVVDTTGAGDTFFGATVHQILELGCPIEQIDSEKIEAILKVSNTAAAICIEGFGGIPSIPSKEALITRLG